MKERNDIALEALPHRAPFRFVSSLTGLTPGVEASGVWTLSGSEWFFAGHFPGDAIIPGVLIAEALAQISGLVGFTSNQKGGGAVRLAQVDIKFHAAIRPPAQVLLHSRLARTMGPLRLFEVVARCREMGSDGRDGRDGEIIAAKGTLTLVGDKAEST